jgi:hypothetical protein
MFNKNLLMIASVVSISLMSGCATLADARAGKGTGMAREYPASLDKVWGTIPSVLIELQLPLVGENKQEGYILAQRGVTLGSYGENVAIFVEQSTGGGKTKVEVVSKKAMATNIFAPDWAKSILDKLSDKFN